MNVATDIDGRRVEVGGLAIVTALDPDVLAAGVANPTRYLVTLGQNHEYQLEPHTARQLGQQIIEKAEQLAEE